MKYVLDHDYHIHSSRSLCSGDETWVPERILQQAEESGLTDICLTDHHWDDRVPLLDTASNFYRVQNWDHIRTVLPLPQSDKVRFHFGCEIDMDMNYNIGMSKESMDRFEFIIIPTTHMHMIGLTLSESDTSFHRRAKLYVERLDALLDKNLPWHKIGIAHLTCHLIGGPRPDFPNHFKILEMISDETFERLFKKAASVGVGIELNTDNLKYTEEQFKNYIIRPYIIAKNMGCKFYFGSDSHRLKEMVPSVERKFKPVVEMLNLTEDDKFRPFG
ncbi:MAG: PHP domain-containing protein [Clostridia bacterium]|nr:PHP domain-containing protein [Clostridia bacterium]